LTDCDIDFVQDGTRDGERVRAWMTRRFAERLQERGARWVKLGGSHDIRMKTAVAACQQLLGQI